MLDLMKIYNLKESVRRTYMTDELIDKCNEAGIAICDDIIATLEKGKASVASDCISKIFTVELPYRYIPISSVSAESHAAFNEDIDTMTKDMEKAVRCAILATLDNSIDNFTWVDTTSFGITIRYRTTSTSRETYKVRLTYIACGGNIRVIV